MLAPSLRSVANWALPRFTLSRLGGGGRSRFARLRTRCSVTSFRHTSGGAISLRSTVNWVLCHFVPPHLGGGTISLCSTANSVLRHFIPPHLGGRDLASLDRELGAPSLRSSAPRGGGGGGAQSRFTRLLNGCFLTSLRRTLGGDLTSLGHSIYRGPIKYFHQIVKLARTPMLSNCSTI